MGRPSKPPGEKHQRKQVSFSPEFMKAARRAAEKRGIAFSVWLEELGRRELKMSERDRAA